MSRKPVGDSHAVRFMEAALKSSGGAGLVGTRMLAKRITSESNTMHAKKRPVRPDLPLRAGRRSRMQTNPRPVFASNRCPPWSSDL